MCDVIHFKGIKILREHGETGLQSLTNGMYEHVENNEKAL